eukprot:TRINITY_DN4375_c0_g2_i1.p1 TRINITY_DN4375_c0_g2~~TRINITY_DN4375_c0_g2_i1.p1  ORF type:complete len:324 (+),score=49.10 TRINITY_DN4375_c0_g2_i1:30-974(+)
MACDTCSDINDVMSTVADVLLALSVACALLSLITFCAFSAIRTYPIKLICYLCICIIIGFTAFIASDKGEIPKNKGACITVAILVHYFFIANFCWTFCIAINFYQMIVKRNREAPKLEKWYHLFSWCVPASLVIGVGSAQHYGAIGSDTRAQCFIDDDLSRFMTFFLPGLFILTANGILFFFISREIHETLAGAPKSDQKDRKKELRIYISIYISIGLSWILGYLMVLVPEEHVATIFLILFTIFTPLQGVFIFIFYCINKKVAAKWSGFFGICIPYCRRIEESMLSSTNSSTSSRYGSSSRSGIDSASSSSNI